MPVYDCGQEDCRSCEQEFRQKSLTWYDIRYSAWADESGLIFSTTDHEIAKAIAAPHGHVILIR